MGGKELEFGNAFLLTISLFRVTGYVMYPIPLSIGCRMLPTQGGASFAIDALHFVQRILRAEWGVAGGGKVICYDLEKAG